MNIETMHTQDIEDVLLAARACLCDDRTSIDSEMFRALFGGVIIGGHELFGEKLNAYNANKHRLPEVLAALAVELERRELQQADNKPSTNVGPGIMKPDTFETFGNPSEKLQHFLDDQPSVTNGEVRVERYRVTVERIDESEDVLKQRLVTLLEQRGHIDKNKAVRAKAKQLGITLD
jgi:hypothetical protein